MTVGPGQSEVQGGFSKSNIDARLHVRLDMEILAICGLCGRHVCPLDYGLAGQKFTCVWTAKFAPSTSHT